MEQLGRYLPQMMSGLWVALTLTAIGFIGAFIMGAVIAALRISPVPPLRIFGTIYVEVFRNVPLLSLLVLFAFGLPDVGLVLSLYATVAICLAMFNAAYVCEAIRTGINAVPRGQIEASRALGFGFLKTVRFVILPQALRTSIQPLVNVFIGTLLGSSLASAIGVYDLIGVAQYINLREAWGIGLFAAAAAVYSSLALGAGHFGGRLERKLAVRR